MKTTFEFDIKFRYQKYAFAKKKKEKYSITEVNFFYIFHARLKRNERLILELPLTNQDVKTIYIYTCTIITY